MLLRFRLSLLVLFAFAVVCAGLVLASFQREELVRQQFSEAALLDRSTVFQQIQRQLINHMEDSAWRLQADNALAHGIGDADREAIRRRAAELAKRLREEDGVHRFDVLLADGSLAYSSRPGVLQSSLIADSVTREAVAAGIRLRGVGNDRQRNIALVLGVPVSSGGQWVGMGVFATDIRVAVEEMERVTQATVVLVNRRGRLLEGAAEALWRDLRAETDLGELDSIQTIEANDRVYSAVVLPQTASVGSLVARVVSIQDVTERALREQYVSRITVVAAVVFLVIVLVGLNFYIFRAFIPLNEGVSVLNALSRGDLRAQIEHTGGRDEVGRIASAVNLFRTSLVAFHSFRRSRERQRQRQERFIRRQLSHLAETLDHEERTEVLAEMERLENQVRRVRVDDTEALSLENAIGGAAAARREESDSLAMTATAFKNLSDRVQVQNQSLRDALAAKNAFIALQRELDIAARVQLSLVPSEALPSPVFEIAGTMRPAKEVGGDFYDFFRLDSNRVGVVIADVSGKGVPSALFMVMVRTLMQSTAHHLERPGEVLARVNDFLEDNNSEELFVTVFYGVLEEDSGRFTFANGGHDPPIISDRNGTRELETTGGIMLGMFPGYEFADASVMLERDSRLVLTTDGISEAFNAQSEAFGNQRLLDLLRAMPAQAPEADLADITGAVKAFAGDAPQFDDITCVVLRYRGRGPEETTNDG